MKTTRLTIAALLLLGLQPLWTSVAEAATCTSINGGTWFAAARWSCGNIPLNTDVVVIGGNHTVNVDAAGAVGSSLTISAGNGNGGVAITAAAGTLAIGGDVTVDALNLANNRTKSLNIGAGTLSVGGALTLNGSNGNRDASLLISTGTVTVAGSINIGGTQSSANITFSGAGTLNIGGNFSSGGTFTRGTGTVVYNGAGAQSVGAYTYNNLTVNKAAGTATLSGNSPVAGNLSVSAGTLDLATFTANRTAAGGSLTVANGATLRIGGTNGFPSNYAVRTLGATSTVEYYGTNQPVSAETYGHLTLSGSATKTPAAGTTTIAGNFTLGAGVTYAGTTNNPTVNLAGNFSNSGTFNSGTGTFTFNGAANQNIAGNSATTFDNLTINNASGVTLSGATNTTVSTLLTLTSGVITTGANTLITSANCNAPAVSRPVGGGHIAGNLQKRIPTGAPVSCTFEIGDATTYRPVAFTFASVTTAGNVTGSVTQSAGDHPDTTNNASGINDTRSVNRYWTFANSGVAFTTFNATFNYVAGDVDGIATPANFVIARGDTCIGSGAGRTCATWATTTPSAPPTSTQASANGFAAFGDFAIGEWETPNFSREPQFIYTRELY